MKSMPPPTLMLLLALPLSAIARSRSPAEPAVTCFIAGTLVHVAARSTAALASTTPKPYWWLKL